MLKNRQWIAALALALGLAGTANAAPGHALSGEAGAAAAEAGKGFVAGARKIAEEFVIVGRTTIDGVTFLVLKGAQGIVYVAEDTAYAAGQMGRWLVKGAKLVYIHTAAGLRWVAVEALKAGEIVFDAVVDVATLVIEDTEYVLIQLENGVTFVARKLVAAGQVVVKGVRLVLRETAEGFVWLADAAWDGIKAGAVWAREKWLVADIRTRLDADHLVGCGAPATDLAFFRNVAADERNSKGLRTLARAALDGSVAFTGTYCPGK